MIRIVGLSATLPNYLDVARFLRVNPHVGLFYFDSRFRPVPLEQTFIGIKAIKPLQQMTDMDSVCYDKVYEMVAKGHQVSFIELRLFYNIVNGWVNPCQFNHKKLILSPTISDFD